MTTKQQKQQHLSDKEKGEILRLAGSGASANAIGRQTGRDRKTVKRFLDQPATKEVLADMFERIARESIESIKPEDIAKSSFLQRVTGAAIATDKMQLLRNQPTQINVSYLLDAVEMVREMRDQEDALSLPGDTRVETGHGPMDPKD